MTGTVLLVIDAWRDHAATWTYDIDALCFAIIGTASVGVWEVTRQGAVRRLEPIERKEAA